MITTSWRLLGEPLVANQYLEHEIVQNPSGPLAPLCWLWTAENFMRVGMFDAAIKAGLEARARYTPKQPYSFFQVGMGQLARCYKESNQPDRAIEIYREVLARNPRGTSPASCEFEIGEILFGAHRDAEALRAYQAVIAAPDGQCNGQLVSEKNLRDLARRSIRRIESGQPWLRRTPEALQTELLGAVRQLDHSALVALACACDFTSGDLFHGGSTEPDLVVPTLIEALRGRVVQVFPSVGDAGLLSTTVWVGAVSEGPAERFGLVLSRARDGWEWSGLIASGRSLDQPGPGESVPDDQMGRGTIATPDSSKTVGISEAEIGAVSGNPARVGDQFREPGQARVTSRFGDVENAVHSVPLGQSTGLRWAARSGSPDDEPALGSGAILAPWPAGTSFSAGGAEFFLEETTIIEPAIVAASAGAGAVAGGPFGFLTWLPGAAVGWGLVVLARLALSQNPCGWGPRGWFYKQGNHDGSFRSPGLLVNPGNRFAIDFTTYYPGLPQSIPSNTGRAFLTRVLAPADGIVGVRVSGTARNQNPSGPGARAPENEVGIFHPYLGDRGPTLVAIERAYRFVFGDDSIDPSTGQISQISYQAYLPRYLTRHEHLDGPLGTPTSIPVSSFMWVYTGTVLGYVDSTGNSGLAHLHFNLNDTEMSWPGANESYYFADNIRSGIYTGASRRPSPMDFDSAGVAQSLTDGDGGKCINSTNVPIDPAAIVLRYGAPGSPQYRAAFEDDLLRLYVSMFPGP